MSDLPDELREPLPVEADEAEALGPHATESDERFYDDLGGETEEDRFAPFWCASAGAEPHAHAFEPAPPRRSFDRRIHYAAVVISLLVHGAVFAAAVYTARHLRLPVIRVALGDQGGDGGTASEPGEASALVMAVPSDIATLPLPPNVFDEMTISNVGSHALEGLLDDPAADGLAVARGADPALSLDFGLPSAATPFGVPATANLVPRPRHLDVSKVFPAVGGHELIASTVASGPAAPVSSVANQTAHTATPPRVAARGSGHGATMGQRGEADGVDSRGLPVADYPAESRRRGEEGLVELDVEVLDNGGVGVVKVVTDCGYPRLNDSAVAAARKAVFEPGTVDDRPATGHLIIPYRFTLH